MLLLRAPSSIVTHIPGRDWDENLWCRYIGNVNVIRVPLYVRGVSPLIYSFITRGDIRVRPVCTTLFVSLSRTSGLGSGTRGAARVYRRII